MMEGNLSQTIEDLRAENAALRTGLTESDMAKTKTFIRDVERLIVENALLLDQRERLKAMLPLFQEARDALCAIPLAAAKLRGLDLTLADRMDDVGVPERWRARKVQS